MKKIYFYETNIGKIKIAEEENKIIQISITDNNLDGRVEETEIIKDTYIQIKEYLDGKRREFQVQINPKGTEFMKKVWNELMNIPYGKTCSYGEIAEKIGNPKASRAVGMANNKNPIMIIIPCHRVIGKNGKMVGYAGGIDIKEKLLNIEKSR